MLAGSLVPLPVGRDVPAVDDAVRHLRARGVRVCRLHGHGRDPALQQLSLQALHLAPEQEGRERREKARVGGRVGTTQGDFVKGRKRVMSFFPTISNAI